MKKLIFVLLFLSLTFCYQTGTKVIDSNSNDYWNIYHNSGLIIDYSHQKGHDGKQFEVCVIYTSIANNATANMFINPSKESHLIGKVSAEGKSYIYLYENPVITGGTTRNIVCTNRNKIGTTTALIKSGVTVSSLGTQLTCEFLPGGTGPNSVGGAAQRVVEWVLSPNANYSLLCVNKSGLAKDYGINLIWYEED